MDPTTEPKPGPREQSSPEEKELKCPFCGGVFPPQLSSRCPRCGKTIVIPLSLRPDSEDLKKRLGESVLKRNSLQREVGGLPTRPVSGIFRKPAVLFGFTLLLLTIGALLIRRAQQTGRMAITPHACGSSSDRQVRPVPGHHPLVELEARTQRDLGILRTALEMFRHDGGRYPTTRESLRALVHPPALPGTRPFYIDGLTPDVWGTAYFYECVGGEVHLASNGPDGIHGTGDDIASPPPNLAIIAQWQAASNVPSAGAIPGRTCGATPGTK